MANLLIAQKINQRGRHLLTLRRAIKDLLDRIAAVLLLTALFPLFVVLAVLISRDGGPVFYAQTRIGQNKRPFKCYKFRTMVPNANVVLKNLLENNPDLRREFEEDHKLKNDPRISRVGKFLRKSSLDELPQLFNVLRGDMSFIGPRPVTRQELKRYGNAVSHYLSVKPGLSGLWQVSGRNNLSYEERVALDKKYVENWSLRNDLIIALKTVVVVVTRHGAY